MSGNKKKMSRTLQPKMFDVGGNGYCGNFAPTNLTCRQCCENEEGPYRGCFKRGEKLS